MNLFFVISIFVKTKFTMEKQLKDTLNFIIENSTNDNIRKSNILSIVDEYITYKKRRPKRMPLFMPSNRLIFAFYSDSRAFLPSSKFVGLLDLFSEGVNQVTKLIIRHRGPFTTDACLDFS